MRSIAGRLGTTAACAFLALTSSPAHAYRTFADDPAVGEPARFAEDRIAWDLSYPPLSRERAEAVELAALRAFSIWSSLSCTSVSPVFHGANALPGAAGDGRSTVTLIASGWGERGLPEGRPATTDVRLIHRDRWEIAEADIYIDIESWQWEELGAGAGAYSLERVLAHEVGHFFGV